MASRCALILFTSLILNAGSPEVERAVEAGRSLSEGDATRLEGVLQSDPESLMARASLLGYYSTPRPAFARNNLVRHVGWVIEHHPESDLAGLGQIQAAANDPRDFDALKRLWLASADQFPNDSRVLENASKFLDPLDLADAVHLEKKALELRPTDRAMSGRLATLLVNALQSSDGTLAVEARENLATCSSAELCGVAGGLLGGLAVEYHPLAESLIARAKSMDPNFVVSMPLGMAANARRIRIGANVQESSIVRSVPPIYPPLAKQARIQGTVRMNAVIGKDGKVENLTLVSGHPLLVNPAMEAVRQWEYKPTLLNGEPVEVITTVEVSFSLSQQETGDTSPKQ